MADSILLNVLPIIAGFMMVIGSLGLTITLVQLVSHFGFGKLVLNAETSEPLSNIDLIKTSFWHSAIPMFLVICGYWLW